MECAQLHLCSIFSNIQLQSQVPGDEAVLMKLSGVIPRTAGLMLSSVIPITAGLIPH